MADEPEIKENPTAKKEYKVDAPPIVVPTDMPDATESSMFLAAKAIANFVIYGKGRLIIEYMDFQFKYNEASPDKVDVFVKDSDKKLVLVGAGIKKIEDLLGECDFEEAVIKFLPKLLEKKKQLVATGDHIAYLLFDGIEFRIGIDKAIVE